MIHLHVLFADDEPDMRDIIEFSLERDPFFVLRGCTSGNEVVANALEWRPDIALIDVRMPDMDGLTVLRRLRADKRTSPIPVVFVTANAAEPDRYKTYGAAGVIAKPFDPMQFAAQVRRFVPIESSLSRVRRDFLRRLDADADALSACRPRLAQGLAEPAVERINAIAHALAGAGGIYGFAGITCESEALSTTAKDILAGRADQAELEQALDRLLRRIKPNESIATGRYSAATA